MNIWIGAGIAFLISGLLELLFLALSLLGVGMGGVLTAGSLAGELRNEEAVIGPLILVFYGVWFLATLVAGPIHVVAGGMMIAGRRSRRWLWTATVVSLLPVATVYCAPTSLLAGVMGLICALTSREDKAA